MNYTLIVTIVIIILLLYVLWNFFSNSGTKLAQTQNLNTTVTTPITVSDTSTRFAYGVWIYVNSWNANGSNKTIFTRSGVADENIIKISGGNGYTTKLYLDSTAPTMYLDIAQSCTGTATTSAIVITTNFPIQKWCYVCFSVDGQYVDCYIDGKLVKSVLLNCNVIAPASTDSVYIGNSNKPNDIYLSGFYHWATPLTPQEVWKKYLNGNGTNPITNATGSVGLGISLFKNNVENSVFRLF
jgi:hypothetical protein